MYLRARTKEQVDQRKREILDAMDSIYLNKEFNSIYLKDIADLTSISRTAIYFYYKSKEEILLDSFYNHFVSLDDGLEVLADRCTCKDEAIQGIASLLEENIIILKIMSSNLEDIEITASLDNLIVLKTELKRFFEYFKKIVFKFNPDVDQNVALSTFISMMYGYYPLAYPIEVQKEAMKQTKTELNVSLKELIVSSLSLILK